MNRYQSDTYLPKLSNRGISFNNKQRSFPLLDLLGLSPLQFLMYKRSGMSVNSIAKQRGIPLEALFRVVSQSFYESWQKLLHLGKITPDVGSSRVDLQACKLEYSIVSPK